MPLTFTDAAPPKSSGLSEQLRRRRGPAAGAAVLAVVLGFWWLTAEEPPAGADGTCVFAFDTDQGTAPVHDQYTGWVASQIELCIPHSARIYGMAATSSTPTDPVEPVDVSLAHADSSGGNERRDREQIDTEVAAALADMDVLIDEAAATSGHTGTDLLGIGPTVDDMLADEDQELRMLVVMSDALHTRHPYNLTVVPLDDAGIEAIISELRETRQMPDLSGVSVRWYGFGMGVDAEELSPERLAQVEQFWRRYFEASGATLETFAKRP